VQLERGGSISYIRTGTAAAHTSRLRARAPRQQCRHRDDANAAH